MLRGIIFDLDGVLTDTAELHFRAWQRLADEEGIAFDRAANERLRGISRADSLRLLLDGHDLPPATFEALLERKNSYYLAQLTDLGPDDLLPGAARLVDDARNRGVLIAVGSASRNARTVLSRLGLTERFHAIVDGNDVERAKPAPDVFAVAAQRLGLPPSSCVVLEDAAAGIDAARAAGMRAVGIGAADTVGHADLRFGTTAEVDLDAVLAVTDMAS